MIINVGASWTDLGVGPVMLQSTYDMHVVASDTMPETADARGFFIRAYGAPSALPVATRLWARSLTANNEVNIEPISDAFGAGTREYKLAAGTRTAIAAASSAAVAIGQLGASREIMLVASSRCHVAFGDAAMGAAAPAAGVLPLPADAMLHLRVPALVTHFRVIRDSADGFLSVIPVA